MPDLPVPAEPPCAFDPHCPLRQALDAVFDRWSPAVLVVLAGGPVRYGALRRRIPDVSQKVLTQTVRRLERDGLVARTVFPTVPPGTEYRLTPLGEAFLQPVLALGRWATGHPAELAAVAARRSAAGH